MCHTWVLPLPLLFIRTKYLQKAIYRYSCFVHINLSLYITNMCICIYDMWKQFEINVLRWCLFVHLFHTPFQNSTYGHVHGQQVNIPVDIRICEEYIYIHIHIYIYTYIKLAIKKFSNKSVSCIHLHKLFQYWNESTIFARRLYLILVKCFKWGREWSPWVRSWLWSHSKES